MRTALEQGVIPGNRVELNLFTTLQCNLQCTYCSIVEGNVRGSQREVAYSLEDLSRFIETHLRDYEIYVTFYGGEPTLNIPFIERVMDRYPLFRYQLQTNGMLLGRLPETVLANLSNILVSLDGSAEVTDGYRGSNVFETVLRNVSDIRARYQGYLTARVTWISEETGLKDFLLLAEHFDWVYWQFAQYDEGYSEDAIVKKKAVVRELLGEFFSRTNQLFPLIPVMGTIRNLLFPRRAEESCGGLTQCRSSTNIINILPDGGIYPCPDMTHLPALRMGDVIRNTLIPSPLQPVPAMPCRDCSAFEFCRRNCMKNLFHAYVENDMGYRQKVVEPICDLIRFMGDEVRRRDPLGFWKRLSVPARREIMGCEIYEFCEVMP